MSLGLGFILVGAAGALVMVVLYIIFVRQIGRKRFENFNASLSYRQYQVTKEQISMNHIVFTERKKWHEGKGVPGGVRSVNSISLAEPSSNYELRTGFSGDQEATEKL